MSADPLGLHDPGQADFNLYAYVGGQALKAVDPLGLESFPTQPAGTMPPPPQAPAPVVALPEMTVTGTPVAARMPAPSGSVPAAELARLGGTMGTAAAGGAALGAAGTAAATLACGASVACGAALGAGALVYGAYEVTKNWDAISSDPHKAFGAITSLAGAGAGASAGQSVGARMRAAIGDAVSGIAARLAPGRAAGGVAAWSPVKVLGRLEDTAVAKSWPGHEVLDIPNWTLAKNAAWIDSGIAARQNFYLASPRAGNMVQTTGRYAGQPTVFALELEQLTAAGYKQLGDYMVHPANVGTFAP